MRNSFERHHQENNENTAERIVRSMEAFKPNPDEFIGQPGYSQKEIQRDTRYADDLRKKFDNPDRDTRHYYHAHALESAIASGVQSGFFLGRSQEVDHSVCIPTSDYDDYAHGVDLAVESYFPEADGTLSSINYGIDLTTRIDPDELRDKILRTNFRTRPGAEKHPQVEDGLPIGFVDIKYYRNPKTDECRRIPMMPRYVIGIDGENIEGLVERTDLVGGTPRIPNDFRTNLKILMEMRAQNSLFLDLASHGGEESDDMENDLTNTEREAIDMIEKIDAIFSAEIGKLIKRVYGDGVSVAQAQSQLAKGDHTFGAIMRTSEALTKSSFDIDERNYEEEIDSHNQKYGQRIVQLAEYTKGHHAA